MLLIFIIISLFLPIMVAKTITIQNAFILLFLELLSVFALIIGFSYCRFIVKWLWVRRHKKTAKHLKSMGYGLAVFIVLELPFQFSPDFSRYNERFSVFSILIVIIAIALFITLFLTAKKNSWIAVLPKKKKKRLILFSLINMGLTLSLIAISVNNSTDDLLSNALLITYGSDTMIMWPVLISSIYFIRIFFSALASLPTSNIVERRTSELSSLTYLNRLVAETIDFENLIETVTRLALVSSGASIAWSEIRESGDKVNVRSTRNIDKAFVDKLYTKVEFKNLFNDLRKPLLIESVPETRNPALDNLQGLPFAKSLIAIPLYAGDLHLGNLVVLHHQEYGFEADDINVLTAFSHNVNIALENARLLHDSLEKERYKRELNLAEEMQKKLLPDALPKVINYSVAAFSLPAAIVGGDYYDMVFFEDGRVCILIGDVSGKGITAAFYMAQLKGVVHAVARQATSAGDILRKINSTLFGVMEKQMFITLTAIVIENENGAITVARAGHLPIILRRDGSEGEMLVPKGLGVGLTRAEVFDTNLEEVSVNLKPSEGCLLFTDGLSELGNDLEQQFDYESLKHFFVTSVYNNKEEVNSSEEILKDLKNKIEKASGNNAQRDDVTALAIIYKPISES